MKIKMWKWVDVGPLSCRRITFIKFTFCSPVYKYVIKVHHGCIFSDVQTISVSVEVKMHWQIPDSYPVYFQKSDLTILDFMLFSFFFFSAPTFISQIPICGPVRGNIWNWVTWTMKVVNPASRQHDQPRKQWRESRMLMFARNIWNLFTPDIRF